MKKTSTLLLIITASLFFLPAKNFCQDWQKELNDYKLFISQHQSITTTELLNMHPAGIFRESAIPMNEVPLYLDSIGLKYSLTGDEKYLIEKHGFVVSERLSNNSFGEAILDIYKKDMPLFISTDAILHAFHSSYDNILKSVELGILIDKLSSMLNSMNGAIPLLETKYAGNNEMRQMLMDVDLYLTVPRKLLDDSAAPFYNENSAGVTEMLGYIADENLIPVNFFSSVPRQIDFSQFKVRGHYDDPHHPELGKYFKAMIWLGRMELYLIAPETLDLKPTEADVQRQTINSILISELVDLANVKNTYDEIEKILTSFVGEQDNVTLLNLNSLIDKTELPDASVLLDTIKLRQFQNTLAEESYAFQKILSQVLMGDPMSPDSIRPASAFMLFGQRFIIDSYVAGNVVFDKIIHDGIRVPRLLPSTLDILYAIGNNAAIQLLKSELDRYHYSANIAGLRYLIDSYDENFWNSTIYNSWLNSIRTLNPPENKSNLPAFMQTGAWWQQKINTQLASWIELRHDNLLYAKQSYTGGITCQFPYSYVEPIPEFYNMMKLLAENSINKMQNVNFSDENKRNEIIDYFNHFGSVMDTLGIIAQKELNGVAFSENEKHFLESTMSYEPMCGGIYNGWYTKLYFPSYEVEEGLLKKDFLVADYHTAPYDETGSLVGYVSHAGTGPINMAVVTAQLPGGQNVAFIGPVMSFYEYTTTNFERLTDDQWKESFQELSLRPSWTNVYLADKNGNRKEIGLNLITGIESEPGNNSDIPATHIIANNYPNPFNNGTIISFNVPLDLTNSLTQVSVYDIQGRVVKKLLDKTLPNGNYLTRWDGTNDYSNWVASGVYFYEIKIGAQRFVGKMNLLK